MSYLKIENMEIAFQSMKGKFVAVTDINLDVENGS
jgi:ABC-type dipeptide/oligopeptide/nickel transport system ATPase subunit